MWCERYPYFKHVFWKGLVKKKQLFRIFSICKFNIFWSIFKITICKYILLLQNTLYTNVLLIKFCRALSWNVYKRQLLVLLIVNFQRLPYQVQKRCMLHPILSITFLRPRYYIVMIFFINNGCLLLYIGSVSFRFKDHLLGIAKSLRLIMKTLRIAFEHLKPYGINQKTSSIYSDIFITATIYLYNQSNQ